MQSLSGNTPACHTRGCRFDPRKMQEFFSFRRKLIRVICLLTRVSQGSGLGIVIYYFWNKFMNTFGSGNYHWSNSSIDLSYSTSGRSNSSIKLSYLTSCWSNSSVNLSHSTSGWSNSSIKLSYLTSRWSNSSIDLSYSTSGWSNSRMPGV